ncbi:transcription factor ORG2-like [Benincasa hispida]|uniref:transcription factor ORG2-like n=1 Tax=Benincasa hispida TaxID=102211 RepID=UPI0019011404|nr:transcription factor ORG2-like [Benincasa hispida]
MEVDDKLTASTIVGVNDLMASRRLNHNASERNRRTKINLLFSSLRSVLPPHDQRKRLSNPATVSVALNYISNLQKQVEELVEKKKQLMISMITRRSQEESSSSLLAVSTNSLSETEIVQIISTFHGIPLSCILLGLQEDGLHPLNISSSLSFGGRIFYYLHLQGCAWVGLRVFFWTNSKIRIDIT